MAQQSLLTHTYDVFVSYKRNADEALRDQFTNAIEALRLRPFCDATALPAGIDWEAALDTVLSAGSTVVLLVLGTNAVLEDPNWVRKEVDLAKERGLDILLVQYAPKVEQKLGLEAIQYRSARAKDREIPFEELVEQLRYDLHEVLRRRLISQRREVESWISETIDALQDNFWTTDALRALSAEGSIALVADGGCGKTVCLAQFMRGVLSQDEDQKCHPIRVTASILKDELDKAADLIGARDADSAAEYAALLRKEWQEWFLFFVDGLDGVGVESPDVLTRIRRTLQRLSEWGRVLVTCRQQVWDESYRVLPFECRVLKELSAGAVRNFLPPGTVLTENQERLLQIPLFLDYGIRLAKSQGRLPETTTDFLRDIYDEGAKMPSRQAVPEPENANIASFLSCLAARQLDHMTFEVSSEEVITRTPLPPASSSEVLETLRNADILHERSGLIRLRHDLIDAYGMARLLAKDKTRRQLLWARLDGDAGWFVSAMLLLIAHEKGLVTIVNETFETFVDILDHKRFSDEMMAKAWAATYALRERVYEVWEKIKEYLDGDLADSLDPGNAEHIRKKVSRPGLVTQETASTLASAFLALSPQRTIASAELVKTLKKWLDRPGYQFKFRFVQALVNLRTKEAHEALIDFARSFKKADDLELTEMLAKSLGESGAPAAAPILKEIYSSDKVSARARRIALEGLRKIDEFGDWPESRMTDDEIVEGLAIKNKRGGYSDWHTVSGYAAIAKQTLQEGKGISPRVADALVSAIEHDQTYVKKPVAECLGWLDGGAARNALLSELLRKSLPMEVRSACIEALRGQFGRRADTQARMEFLLALLVGVHAARQRGASLAARDLLDLANDKNLIRPADWCFTPLAVQALPLAPSAGWKTRGNSISSEDYPACISADALITDEERVRIGEPLETKYRLVGVALAEGRNLTLQVAPTDWVSACSFHVVANRDLSAIINAMGRWPEPLPLGTDRLPGLLAVHCIVLTSDGQLLLAKRSCDTIYRPGTWSISFEEQVTARDFQQEEDFVSAAARRGFAEEFGENLRIKNVSALSGLIEVETLNFGLLVLVLTDETAEAIADRWRSEPRPTDHSEASEVRSLAISPAGLLDEEMSGLSLHPTSKLRVECWRRWQLQ